jgi:hypothetical protein
MVHPVMALAGWFPSLPQPELPALPTPTLTTYEKHLRAPEQKKKLIESAYEPGEMRCQQCWTIRAFPAEFEDKVHGFGRPTLRCNPCKEIERRCREKRKHRVVSQSTRPRVLRAAGVPR